MSIACVDEATENNPQTWKSSRYVQAQPTRYVVFAGYRNFIRVFYIQKEVDRTNLEEEVEVDVAVGGVDEEMNRKQQIYETQFLALLQKPP